MPSTSGLIDLSDVPGRRVLTGFRPTGKLHIGHLIGNIRSLVELQDSAEMFLFVADWHMLSTDYDRAEALPQNTWDLVADLMAAGIDPAKSVVYRQSDLPEVAELALYFSMITPISWLERNPTYKEQVAELSERDISTHGFLGYPILQTADITIVKGEVVPVGSDQLPHLELGREIVRRFRSIFHAAVFPEPLALVGDAPRVPGSDGRKMSKSYGNAIFLSDPADIVDAKVRKYITDPAKIHLGDPGHPEVCDVFSLHGVFTPASDVTVVDQECRSGTRGCVSCKEELAANINLALEPIRERRAQIEKKPEVVDEVLAAGADVVAPVARETLLEVRSALDLGPSRVPEGVEP